MKIALGDSRRFSDELVVALGARFSVSRVLHVLGGLGSTACKLLSAAGLNDACLRVWRYPKGGIAFLPLLLMAWHSPLGAQVVASPVDLLEVELSLEQIQRDRDRAAENRELDLDVRSRVVELYEAAAKSIAAARAFEAQAERFEQQAAVSKARIQALQVELDLAAAAEVTVPDVPADVTTAEMEELLTRARAELTAARQALLDEDQLSTQRSARRREISGRLGTLNQRVMQIDDSLRETIQTEQIIELRVASQTNLLARRMAVKAEIAALQAELNRHVARAPALPLRRDRAQLRVLQAQRTAASFAERSRELRQAEMREQLARARALAGEAVRSAPSLEPLATEVMELTALLSGNEGVRMKLEQERQELGDTRKRITDIRQAAEISRRKWDAVRLQGLAAQWWPTVSVDLRQPALLRREIQEHALQIPDCQRQLILLEERRALAGDVQGELAKVSSAVSSTATTADPERAVALARELLRLRRELLDELITYTTQHSNLLYEVRSALVELLAEIESLDNFILARVLWVRSVSGSSWPSARGIAGGLGWLFGDSSWPLVWKEVFRSAWKTPLISLSGLLIVLILFVLRPRCQRRLAVLADRVQGPDATIGATAEAIALTVLFAAPIPTLLLLASSLLSLAAQFQVARAAAAGLQSCGLLAATLVLVAQSCRPRGVVEAHFLWAENLTSAVYRNGRRALAFALFPAFVSVALRNAGMLFHNPVELQNWNNDLGRLSFVATLIVICVFSNRALNPMVPVLSRLTRTPRSLARFHYAGLVAVNSVVLIPAVLALLGYYISAALLVYFIGRSALLALGLALIYGLLRRWETVRLLRIAAARGEDVFAAETVRVSGDRRLDDLAAPPAAGLLVAKAQVRGFIRYGVLLAGLVGLMVIWAPFVPTMRMLDQIQILPSIRFLTDEELAQTRDTRTYTRFLRKATQSETEEARSLAGSSPSVVGLPSPVPKTAPPADKTATPGKPGYSLVLADLLISLSLVLTTFVTAKSIPGLLELAVLPKVGMEAGVRTAIGTLVRYGIVLVGLSFALALLGLSWSSIQWLAAAMTFGLAFGLQEIFANVVSGVILLVERPIRIGDAVTIGTTSGTVARIQLRATTIMAWDKSELIVPNKALITGQLVNWTLSDLRVRLDVPVGVAYGSDIEMVKTALREVARRNPSVLEEPVPEVLFCEFGESALKLELRVFINFRDGCPQVRDRLQVEIDREFRERNIVIAFPQMDVHLKSGSILPPAEGASSEVR